MRGWSCCAEVARATPQGQGNGSDFLGTGRVIPGTPQSVPHDVALAAGGLQAVAEPRGILGRAKRSDHGAVIYALVAQIGAANRSAPGAQDRRILALQGPVRGLGIGLATLRGDLNDVVSRAA